MFTVRKIMKKYGEELKEIIGKYDRCDYIASITGFRTDKEGRELYAKMKQEREIYGMRIKYLFIAISKEYHGNIVLRLITTKDYYGVNYLRKNKEKPLFMVYRKRGDYNDKIQS